MNHTTDQLLTLGMALTSDKRSMERRVRGVFARRKSAKGALILSLLLVLALGFAAFTTACQPGTAAEKLTPIPVEQEQAEPTERASIEPMETPDPIDEMFEGMQLKTEQDLYGNLAQAPFVYPVSDKHITREPETLKGGVRILVDADVVIPQAAGYGIRQCDRFGFTLEDYQKLIDLLMPQAEWLPSADNSAILPNGTLDLSKVNLEEGTMLTAEVIGQPYTRTLFASEHVFSVGRDDAIVYREGFLVGDEEMEREFGEAIREPIALTQDAAKAKADELLSTLGARDWVLDSAERACMFEDGNTQNVLSRGWDFVYMLNNGGLPVHYYGGTSGGGNDKLDYRGSDAGWLWVYVDESGISRVYWINRYKPRSPEYSNVAILGVEDALRLAKERLTRLYGVREVDVPYDVEIYAIRLSSMLLAYSDEPVRGIYDYDQRDMTHMVPTWDVSCREVFANGGGEYFTLPFCASDGGSITMMG